MPFSGHIDDNSEYTVIGFQINRYSALTIVISKAKGAFPDATLFAYFESFYQWKCCEYCMGEDDIDNSIGIVLREGQRFLRRRWNKPEYESLKWWNTEEEAYKNALVIKPIRHNRSKNQQKRRLQE